MEHNIPTGAAALTFSNKNKAITWVLFSQASVSTVIRSMSDPQKRDFKIESDQKTLGRENTDIFLLLIIELFYFLFD